MEDEEGDDLGDCTDALLESLVVSAEEALLLATLGVRTPDLEHAVRSFRDRACGLRDVLSVKELCRKEGHGFVDGTTQDWSGMIKADGVHFNKRGSEVFGRILRGGVRAVVASQHQEAEELQLQRDLVEEEHQELRRQYGDQAAPLLENFPPPPHPVPSHTLHIPETNDEMAA